MKDFRDKTAVITGAASGIGRAIARRLAAEGTRLVLADVDDIGLAETEQALSHTGVRVVRVHTDVSQRSAVESLAERTLSHFGAVHVLFNNAGVFAGAAAWETSWEDWEWVLNINLWGVINGIKVFVPLMLAQDTVCHIVNTASITGMLADNPSAPYQTSKHAVVGLSESLYYSLMRRGAKVKTSVLCPGWVHTRILQTERYRSAQPNPVAAPDPDASFIAGAEAAMSPEQVAEITLAGIREERFYIFTHPQDTPRIEHRMANILAGRNPD